MKAYEMREMTVQELREALRELEEEYFNLRVRKATQEVENPLALRTVRRKIARAKTLLGAHDRGQITLVGTSDEE